MPSLVMEDGTSLSGMWPVATATRSWGETMIIAISRAPKASWRYSVWPVKPKPSAVIARLLIGPVTRTSM